MSKWTSTAGPRQTKAVNQALRDFEWKAKSIREVTDYSPDGVILTPMFSGTYAPGYAEAIQRIGDAYGWTVTRENHAALTADIIQAKAALVIPTVDKRTTAEERAAMAIERAERDKQREEESRKHAAEYSKTVAELRVKYPWAKPATATDAKGRQISTHARAAANLREELRRTFPGIAFSVRSESFSMGNSVDASWVLGPTTDEVDKIAGKYKYGTFDGMQDMYENDNSADGEAVESVLGRAKYVGTSREIPADVREVVGRSVCELQSKEYTGLNAYNLYGDGDYSVTVGEHVYRMFRECSLPAGAIVTGAENIPEAEHDKYREPYRVAFTVPMSAPVVPTEETQASPVGCKVAKYTHTKKGTDFYLVTSAERLDGERFDLLRQRCKTAGGWYSRKWGSTPGGFAFDTQSSADAFASAFFGAETPATVNQSADVPEVADDTPDAGESTPAAFPVTLASNEVDTSEIEAMAWV